ncbi:MULTISPECIES: hypothetical protein [Streptomyces]
MTSTAEWIGSGAIGVGAAVLVGAAARLGAAFGHASADAELAAYHARHIAATNPAPYEAPFEVPPMPDRPPADPAPDHDQTLQIHEVKAYRRARHRKDPACI